MNIITTHSWPKLYSKPLASKSYLTEGQAKHTKPFASSSDRVTLSTVDIKGIVRQHPGQTSRSPSPIDLIAPTKPMPMPPIDLIAPTKPMAQPPGWDEQPTSAESGAVVFHDSETGETDILG